MQVLQDAKEFALNTVGWQLYTTSAVTGEYIHVALKELIDRLLNRKDIWQTLIHEKHERQSNIVLTRDGSRTKNSSGCCLKKNK